MAVAPAVIHIAVKAATSKKGRKIILGGAAVCVALVFLLFAFPFFAVLGMLLPGASVTSAGSEALHTALLRDIQRKENRKNYVLLNPEAVAGSLIPNSGYDAGLPYDTGYVLMDNFNSVYLKAMRYAACVEDVSDYKAGDVEKNISRYFDITESRTQDSPAITPPKSTNMAVSSSITKVVTVSISFDAAAFEKSLELSSQQITGINALMSALSIVTGSTYSTGTPGDMSVSDNLVAFLEREEGYSPVAYVGEDVQNRTIGYGHVIQPGESFTYLSPEDAEALLKSDLVSYEAAVNRVFGDTTLTQSQFDALVSLDYNLGNSIWGYISLTGDVKANASPEIIQEDFLCLDHVGSQVSPGLRNRREAEYLMYEDGEY